MPALLESYRPIFFCAAFHCCSFLLFKLPAVFEEVTCKPCHSLTLKPHEHLAGAVLVPQPTAAEPQALVSVQRRQRHLVLRKQCQADPGNSQTCSQATRGSPVDSVLRGTCSSPGQLLLQHLAIVILDYTQRKPFPH